MSRLSGFAEAGRLNKLDFSCRRRARMRNAVCRGEPISGFFTRPAGVTEREAHLLRLAACCAGGLCTGHARCVAPAPAWPVGTPGGACSSVSLPTAATLGAAAVGIGQAITVSAHRHHGHDEAWRGC
ncbi:MAG: hypothetical protein U5O16_21400 [Rhodococcus sp. (in: high G+C Gram-positive bacteria)]|uniref:hypothetical protein n=1 Tax=Rhodococcus sp. TaxID=1831 RepID=UPI002AD8D623|nr:hypothetical protein [Rhodococcus sp. (in: high G+C Gram-positive bacteria)]